MMEGELNIVEYIDRLSLPHIDNELHAESLLEAFEEHIELLWKQHEEAKNEVNRLELVSRSGEDRHVTTLQRAADEIEDGMDSLQSLGTNIAAVAVKLVHVGDQLEGAKGRRDRAVDASTLIRHFSAFDDFDSRLLPPFDKLEHRADLDDRDLARGVDRTRRPQDEHLSDDELGVAAALMVKMKHLAAELNPQACTTARQRIAFVNQELEEQCVAEFRRSLVLDKVDRMKFMARTLQSLSPKKHAKVMDVMIDHIMTGFHGLDANVFEAAIQLCKQAASLTSRVFDDPSTVLHLFVHKVFHRVIEAHVSKEMNRAGDKMQCLYNLFLRVGETAAELDEELEMHMDAAMKNDLCRSVFNSYLPDYLDSELDLLRDAYTSALSSFYNEISHERISKGTSPKLGRRLVRGSGDDETPRGDLVDDTLAIGMIHDNQVALHRCAVVAPKTKVAEWCFRIFVELLDGLCKEHLGYALWYGIKTLPPRKPKSEPSLVFLQTMHDVNSTVFLVQKHYQSNVAPLVASNPDVLQACVSRKNAVMTRLEEDIGTGLARCMGAVTEWTKHCLAQQDKHDFKPEDPAVLALSCTKACEMATTFLSKVIKKLGVCLNGKNLSKAQRHLGCAVHSMLMTHITQFTFNGIGAIVLTRDLAAYQHCCAQLQDTFVDGLFDTLKDLSQLLMVKAETIPQLCREGNLVSMDRAVVMRFLHLRHDYKSSKLATLKL
ncbi:hypothetical protein PTSG_05805 [Salpingoeca rosetta]|uniref:Uncharacterized protein n=1 Tax=Salpingoeca rosetta (strain ATCC 50818 / BSB-021) TaxID=946362 RepID=F2UCU5_SALR5|nr:uncharacterized protein PTSG_05805 [Salpingoeca rosetta]EGD74440.1 hypothetical protein PTSG_05805 [Salpingoeca rosetta]|eukprot:XP_004992697.1 hypothetical protein PTSG_05805 [Salpingoeca rosetta]